MPSKIRVLSCKIKNKNTGTKTIVITIPVTPLIILTKLNNTGFTVPKLTIDEILSYADLKLSLLAIWSLTKATMLSHILQLKPLLIVCYIYLDILVLSCIFIPEGWNRGWNDEKA